MKEPKTSVKDGSVWHGLFQVWREKLALPDTQRSYNRFLRGDGPVYSAMVREAGHNRILRKTIMDAQHADRNKERGVYAPADQS